MIAADSSVLAKYLLREDGWEFIRKYLEEGCATLDLAFKEVANALWKRVAKGELNTEYAVKVLSALVKLDLVKTIDQKTLLPEAFMIAAKHRITVYDALFITLAKKVEAPLLTADKTQAKTGEKEGIKIIQA